MWLSLLHRIPERFRPGVALLAGFDLTDEIPHFPCQQVRNFHLHVVAHALEGLQAGVWHLLGHQMLDFLGSNLVQGVPRN